MKSASRFTLPLLLTISLLTLASCQQQPEPPAAAPPEAAAPADDCQGPVPAEPVACTMQWDPVCGCDGETYGNACGARAAGILRFTPGECDGATEQ